MKVAVPEFGSRVAPTFLYSDNVIIARIFKGGIVFVETLKTGNMTEDERIKLLEDANVTVLACGGIARELRSELESKGIEVIHNVAGETAQVLEYLARGQLHPGCGISYHPEDLKREKGAQGQGDKKEKKPILVDCLSCPEKVCLEGAKCQQHFDRTTVTHTGTDFRRMTDAAADISAEPERILCRIAELVYFCVEMDYECMGLAFCSDLFSEAHAVAQVLRRFVRLAPVCCRIDGTAEQTKAPEDFPGLKCNPFAMARVLNEAGTDLNVAAGLCIGCDIVFSQMSLAPVTTLFVKDKLLAHNPISAVHSRYVLERILKTT